MPLTIDDVESAVWALPPGVILESCVPSYSRTRIDVSIRAGYRSSRLSIHVDTPADQISGLLREAARDLVARVADSRWLERREPW